MSKFETIPVPAALVEDQHWWFATRTWASERAGAANPTERSVEKSGDRQRGGFWAAVCPCLSQCRSAVHSHAR